MGRVFRRITKKPLPVNATITKAASGKLTATWKTRGRTFKVDVMPDGTHYRWKAKHWTVEYMPHNGPPARLKTTTFTEKAAAERHLKQLEAREQNRQLGLITEEDEERQRFLAMPIAAHIDAFVQDLRNERRTPRHIRDIEQKLQAICDFGAIRTLADLRLSLAREAIAKVADARSLSDRTRSHYVTKLKQFANWLVADKRLESSPLLKLKPNKVLTFKHPRRPLEHAELEYLLAATMERTRPNHKIPARDRVSFYLLLACTGYRKKETASLRPRNFFAHGAELMVRLPATEGKNRKRDERVIPHSHAEWFRLWLANRTPDEVLFPLPHKFNKALRGDMAAGRAMWVNDAPTAEERQRREASDFLKYQDSEGRFADFHSFRHAYCTELQRLGAAPDVLLRLQRHADPKMAAHYWHASETETADLQHRLGSRLPAPPLRAQDTMTPSAPTGAPSSSQCAVQCAKFKPEGVSSRHGVSSGELSNPRKRTRNAEDHELRRKVQTSFPNHGPFSFCLLSRICG